MARRLWPSRALGALCCWAALLGLAQLGQAHNALQVHSVQPAAASARVSTCASLKNHQSHSTVRVQAGTPPQEFDLVADTGSDLLIVDSCVCQDFRKCDKRDKCFRGTNHSSTFRVGKDLPGPPDARGVRNASAGPPMMVLTFGSGQIECVVGSDVARVGAASAVMDDSLLLMVDRALQIEGAFEGILGLGVPKAEDMILARARAQAEAQAQRRPMAPVSVAGAAEDMAQRRPPASVAGAARAVVPKPFLEAANIDRFSLCFNADNSDGVLRLGGELPEATAHDNLGQMHWGLDFRGVSIGNETAPVAFCDPSQKDPKQATACGAIPDSGTTVMMGAPEHLLKLFDGLCQEWDRCRTLAATLDAKAATGGEEEEIEVEVLQEDPPAKEAETSAAAGTAAASADQREAELEARLRRQQAFHDLLMNCTQWAPKGDVSEMPSLFFKLGGAGGTEQTLELPAAAYVMRVRKEEVKHVHKKLMGVIPVEEAIYTGKMVEVCAPAFGAQDYVTEKNGPVWILGTPIFYQYNVGYNLGGHPSISFSSAPCGHCTADGQEAPAPPARGDKVGFLTARSNVSADTAVRAKRRIARHHAGPLRLPDLDTSLPL